MNDAPDLTLLIETEVEDDLYVPGEGPSRTPASFEPPDWLDLAQELVRAATQESSALAKSRALTVAGLLLSSEGKLDEGIERLRDAATTSPRLGLCTHLLAKYAQSAGSAKYEELGSDIVQSWEGASRHAPDEAWRKHAYRVLLDEYVRLGRNDEAQALLDRLVRAGEGDVCLELERIVSRLAEKKTLSGMNQPVAFAQDISLASEVVLDRTSPISTSELSKCGDVGRDLLVLRAARDLKQGNVEGCINALEFSGLPADAVLEFAGALYGAAPGGSTDRVRILWKLARSKPERRIFRQLLVASVLAGDRVSVAHALDQIDPSAGTLLLRERLLLASFAGQHWSHTEEELRELFNSDPNTALALVSPLRPVVSAQHASDDALLIQIGAALGRLKRFKSDQEPKANELHQVDEQLAQTDLKTALNELEARGEHPALCAALRLDDARQAEDHLRFVEALRYLSESAGSRLGDFMAATVLHRTGQFEAARHSYAQLFEHEFPHVRLAAWRGLLTLWQHRTQTAESAAETAEIELPPPPALMDDEVDELTQLMTQLEQTLSSSVPSFRAAQIINLFLGRLPHATAGEQRALGVQLFAAGIYADQVGSSDAARAALLAVSEQDLLASHLARLTNVWQTLPSLTHSELAHLRASGDPSLRALAAWLGTRDGTTATVNVNSAEALPSAGITRLEYQFQFAARLVSQDLRSASHALSEAVALTPPQDSPSEQPLRDLLIDLSELEVAQLGDGASGLASAHFGQLSQGNTGQETRRFALERLAELDERRRDKTSALMWRRALSDAFPQDIASQLRLEELQYEVGETTHTTAQRLSEILPPSDRDSYRALVGTQALIQSDLRMARKVLEPMLDEPRPPLLALRSLVIIAREKRDDDLLARCYEQLTTRETSSLDRITLHYELALIRSRQGREHEAQVELRSALALSPQAFTLRQLETHLLKPELPTERADLRRAFAQASAAAPHKLQLFREAAAAYLEGAALTSAAECFEIILGLTPDDQPAYRALIRIHQQTQNMSAQRAVYERRLNHVARRGSEQLEIELSLSELLMENGELAEAKAHLETLLIDHPDCLDALRIHAQLSRQVADLHSAERSLVALRQRLEKGTERLQIIGQLGAIYFEHTGQMEKAMDAYQEILIDFPEDEAAQIRLVDIYCNLGLAERAAQLQTQLIQIAELAETKRSLALRLADIYENIGRDPEKAAATLERTRKAWPLDADVLTSSIQFLDRHGDSSNRGITLSRAEKDARRKLESGPIDHALLDTLACIAQLSGRQAEAEACAAARGTYLGLDDAQIKPAGLHCLSPRIDQDLAPQGYPEPFRRLLQKTADAMDAAFSVDLSAMGARPLIDGPIHDRVQKIAEAIGWPRIELFVSDALGARCLPVSRRPPRLLLGTGLEELSGRARDYLLLRAFKLQIMGVGALSRSREEDRFAGIVALLLLFSPNWRPPEIDARKVAKARALIEQGLARVGYDDEVPTLALEAIGALSGKNDGLVDAPRTLASRACLVGVGDLSAVFEAMAAGEGKPLSANGPSRFRFIDSHPEARELLLFMTTPAFTKARISLGLVAEPEFKSGPSASSNVSLPQRPPGASRVPLPPGASRAPLPPGASAAPLPPRRPKPPPPKR